MVGLAELDAYYARKTADEYGTITVDDDYWVTTNQIYYDNYQASNLKRQEINDTKTATDKTNSRQARRDNNNDYTEYFEAWLALQTTYEIAIATADETYYNTVTTADTTYNTTVTQAEETFENDYCRLTGQYCDALQLIDSGGTVDSNFYDNGTSSLNVQVCFPAGTPVLLADGTTKNIEDIQPGDKVEVPDQNNPEGLKQICKIIEIYHNDPQPVLRLKFQSFSDSSEFEIRATEGHRFYVRNIGWQHAADIVIGSELLNEKGESIVLLEKDLEPELVPVYNFQVENAHTYFVGENKKHCVLGHNEGCNWWSDEWTDWINPCAYGASFGDWAVVSIYTVGSWYSDNTTKRNLREQLSRIDANSQEILNTYKADASTIATLSSLASTAYVFESVTPSMAASRVEIAALSVSPKTLPIKTVTNFYKQSELSKRLAPGIADGHYIYARNPLGAINVGPEYINHPELFGSQQPLTAAGELWIEKGRVVKINNQSGNYQFNGSELKTVVVDINKIMGGNPKKIQIINVVEK
jgi:hypothetical protein